MSSMKIERATNTFLKDVKKFITAKNNGVIPAEWSMSLKLLETYYRQFLQATAELEQLDSLTIEGKYGPQPHPTLKIQSQASVRLEKMMAELGLSLKSATKLDLAKPVAEQSVLSKFIKNNSKVEKR